MNSVKRKFALALSKRIGVDIALASHKDASLEDFAVKVVVKDGNGSTSSSLCARAFFQEFGEAKRIGFVAQERYYRRCSGGQRHYYSSGVWLPLETLILQLPEIDNDDEEEADLASPARGTSPTLLDT
jgi:hypothetical protein